MLVLDSTENQNIKKNVRLRQRILIDGFWRGSLVFLIQTWNDKSYVWLDPNMVMEGK